MPPCLMIKETYHLREDAPCCQATLQALAEQPACTDWTCTARDIGGF